MAMPSAREELLELSLEVARVAEAALGTIPREVEQIFAS
jgi:hypothetical protein